MQADLSRPCRVFQFYYEPGKKFALGIGSGFLVSKEKFSKDWPLFDWTFIKIIPQADLSRQCRIVLFSYDPGKKFELGIGSGFLVSKEKFSKDWPLFDWTFIKIIPQVDLSRQCRIVLFSYDPGKKFELGIGSGFLVSKEKVSKDWLLFDWTFIKIIPQADLSSHAEFLYFITTPENNSS